MRLLASVVRSLMVQLTFDVVVVWEEEVRLEAPVLVEGDGGVVGGEDVEVDGAHVAVVVNAGAQVREEVAQHEGGDTVAAVLLQHAQRQYVRDLGAVPACNWNRSLSEFSHGYRLHKKPGG